MGENICKQCNWQGVNLQDIETAYVTQYENTNRDLPGGAVSKDLPANAGDMGSLLGSE